LVGRVRAAIFVSVAEAPISVAHNPLKPKIARRLEQFIAVPIGMLDVLDTLALRVREGPSLNTGNPPQVPQTPLRSICGG
jgi:hypothetical protein